jgi:hypothetical protein
MLKILSLAICYVKRKTFLNYITIALGVWGLGEAGVRYLLDF